MGLHDTAEQLDACRAQSVTDERRIADLEATIEGLARQNTELEHDLARAETALADRLQHDAHARPAAHTLDEGKLFAILASGSPLRMAGPLQERMAEEILALLQPADGILLTPEEAALAARAARHSAESIRAVLDVDPTRLHPDVAGYVTRLNDLADRLQAGA